MILGSELHEELRTNDKLYHWRYGLMIVNSLNGPYVNVTIDDPESVMDSIW